MNKIEEPLVPVVGLVVYTSEKHCFVEEYKIKETADNQFKFGSAKPMGKKTLGKMFNLIEDIDLTKYYFEGLIPNNLIYYSYKDNTLQLIWKIKSTPKYLSFSKDLRIKNGLKVIPNLIFSLKGDQLSVVATKTYEIDLETETYHAPFHNIYNTGNVCMGSAEINFNINIIEELIKNIEKCFFNSVFTHLNHTLFENNINTMWRRNDFKEDDLIKKRQVKDLL